MKRLMKKVLAMGMLCVMLMGTSITSGATVHTCAHSYMGKIIYNVLDGGSHPYTVYNVQTGKSETRYCKIEYVFYKEVWKCACGDTYYIDLSPIVEHSDYCGS